ncbi:hypothetical protein Q7P37_011352 [Cladosporium fusiforme]
MSLSRNVDRFLYHESQDRMTAYVDSRAYVRLPARALRSIARETWLLLTCSWTVLLLPVTVTALALRGAELDSALKFWLHYVALLPVVGVFRYASEALSVSVSTTRKICGMVLVLISIDIEVAFVALCYGKLAFIKAYLVGKVVTTLLLTLGVCFIAAGMRRSETMFAEITASTMSSLLVTATVPYGIITVLSASTHESGPESSGLILSRASSLVLGVLFLIYQFFRGSSHASLFDLAEAPGPESEPESDDEFLDLYSQPIFRTIGAGTAVIALVAAVSAAYFCAEELCMMLGDGSSPGQELFGFCLLPLLAEAAELKQIGLKAYQGEMDISFQAATATGINIALLIGPMFCLIGWSLGQQLDLDLGIFEFVLLGVSIWVFATSTQIGKSNYLQGATILGLYAIQVLAFVQKARLQKGP